MATPNYSFEKRQRELAKKRKAEEKRMRKSDPQGADPGNGAHDAPDSTVEDGQPQPVSPTPGQAS